MRIALISLGWGEYNARLANGLVKHGDVALLIGASEVTPRFKELLDPSVKVYPFNRPRIRQPLKQFHTMRKILRDVRQFQPDVIHVQIGHLYLNMTFPFLRRYPFVITIHDAVNHVGDADSRKVPEWVLHWGYKQADELIVHTKSVKSIIQNKLHLQNERLHLIPHITLGTDIPAEDLIGKEEDNTILFFGRIWEYKGLDYLIKAEPLITAAIPDAKIVIGGRGEDFSRYEQMMVHPENFVVHNEFISDEKLDQLFKQASVVVLPYIEASNSGVIPVAYSYGKPVIATNVGGLPEAVDEEETGLLVPPRDEKALAEAVIMLLKDKARRQEMGRKAKHKNDVEWGSETIGNQTAEVYRKAIERHHHR